jgi:hypothetical protein
LETFDQPLHDEEGFLHLDFTPNNNVVIPRDELRNTTGCLRGNSRGVPALFDESNVSR